MEQEVGRSRLEPNGDLNACRPFRNFGTHSWTFPVAVGENRELCKELALFSLLSRKRPQPEKSRVLAWQSAFGILFPFQSRDRIGGAARANLCCCRWASRTRQSGALWWRR